MTKPTDSWEWKDMELRCWIRELRINIFCTLSCSTLCCSNIFRRSVASNFNSSFLSTYVRCGCAIFSQSLDIAHYNKVQLTLFWMVLGRGRRGSNSSVLWIEGRTGWGAGFLDLCFCLGAVSGACPMKSQPTNCGIYRCGATHLEGWWWWLLTTRTCPSGNIGLGCSIECISNTCCRRRRC